MANNYKKIILSGGWGYGNLGDDAILLSSYNLIKNRFPNSDIIILSYNIRESSLVLPESENIRYYDSLHVSMYGYKPNVLSFGEGLLPELWKPIKSRYNKKVIKRIRDSKLRNKVIKNKEEFKEQYRKQFQEFSDICRESDMYIMCGGGYLTGWAEMITSKYFEVEIAKKNSLKTYIIGQTIGPFTSDSARFLIKSILDITDNSFFRDKESLSDAKSFGAKCLDKVIPDLVLSTERTAEKKNYIVFIPFLSDLTKNKEKIVQNIAAVSEKHKCSVCITVSQLWPYGMQIGLSIYLELLARNIDARFVVPHDFHELSDILASAQMTYSQNLHGLILSYCAHTPVASLNSRRKFISFMEAIGQPDNLLAPNKLSPTDFLKCYEKRSEFDFSKLQLFRKEINDALDLIVKE